MRRHAPCSLLAVLALAGPAIASAGEAPAAAPTGLARFTVHSRFVGAKISPKGTYLAGEVMQGGRRGLVFIKLASNEVASTFNPGGITTIGRFFWSSDEQVVIELEDQDGTLAGPVGRGEIYAVNANGTGGRFIFGYRTGGGTGTHLKVAEPEYAWGRVVDTLRHDDRYILVSSTSMKEEGDRQVRLWKVDTLTGLKTLVAVGPIPAARFFTDEDGELRFASGPDVDYRWHYFLRQEDRTWRELNTLTGLGMGSWPVAFLAKDRAIEVVEPMGSGFGLYSVALETGERKLLVKTEIAPPSGFLRDQTTGRALAVESAPDLPAVEFLDPAHPIARVLDGLLAAYPGQHVKILNRTDDDRLAVAYVYGDRHPGQYLVVDVAKLSADVLGSSRPWIVPDEMAEMQAFHIAASDGIRIHGYLTLPRGLPPGQAPPLVVLPHGGPHGVRDHWGFDPQVQLLASRGFAVLQVNYRGSGGYGEAFQEAGYRHWGDRVVQDVLDATRWAIRKGRVDGGRVCTFGGSFGAYAAMQAVILAPDLFRCAAGYAGVYDLTIMASRGDISWGGLGRGKVRRTVGDDEAELRAASPAFNAEKLTVPVFLAHGGSDERAPIVHARKLRDALTRLGRAPAWLEEPGEGHGFFKEEARLRFATQLVQFLEANTSPRAAPATGPTGQAAAASPPAVPRP